jgi:outer membrane protein
VPEGFDVVDSWNRALTARPDYNQLKEELEKQNLLLKFNYNQLFPSLDLTGSIGRSGLSDHTGGGLEQIRDRDFPNWSAGAVVTIPLMRTTERNNYRRNKAEQKRALLQLKQLEEAIVYEIDDAVTKARSDFQQITATRQAREFAEAALQAEQTKLENGRSTSFVVLELQNKLTQARSAEIDALSGYKKSLSNLHFKEGTTLERNKVVITDK